MSDPNRPEDPGQQNDPQVPSAGSPYGAPANYGAAGQQGYGPSPQAPYGSAPQPGLGQQPTGQPQFGQPQFGQQPAGPQPGFGQQPAGPQPGFGQQPAGPQPGFGQPPVQGGFQAPGIGAQPTAQFGAGGGQQQPPSGWGAPMPPTQPGRPGSKVPLIIGGAVVVIIALIFGVTQLFNRTSTGTGGTPATASPKASTGSGVGAGSATEVVQKYFDALAASDPEAIFALVRGDLPDRTFLTKEVLTAATQAAPITNLKLTETKSTKYSAEIQADYTINSRTQTQKFYVSARDNAWHLNTVAGRLYVKGLSPADTGLTVNGVAVPTDADSIDVFPGGYALGTTSDTFGLSQGKIVVESLGSVSDVYDIKVVLSTGALKDFKAATTKLVNSCKKPGGLANAPCGINFKQPTGVKIKAGSVACTPSGTGSIDRMKPTLDTSDLSVRASLSVKFACKMTATNGSRFTGTDYLFSVYGKKTDSGWTASAQRP